MNYFWDLLLTGQGETTGAQGSKWVFSLYLMIAACSFKLIYFFRVGKGGAWARKRVLGKYRVKWERLEARRRGKRKKKQTPVSWVVPNAAKQSKTYLSFTVHI